MRRADRLFQIVQALRGGRLVTARRLSEDLEVSERTIYRDMADLIGSGVPVEGEAGVGYLMRSGYEMPPLMFTRAEITSLVAGARLMKAWGGLDMAKAAEEALVKIDAVLPDAVRNQAKTVQIHAFTWNEMDDQTRARLDALEAAVDGLDRLSIQYEALEGAETTRIVRPLGLWFWGKVWTLVGWCELRDDFRMFRVDRIAAMETIGKFRHERGKRLTDFYDTKDHG
jgi:predicted DNA-binding transcriptional regulator YafY